MKLRDSRKLKKPELVIIPMIDIMFFLLVFFMLSTMYMIDLKTIPVKLPVATSASIETKTTYAVTLKKDGTIYLGDKKTDLKSLLTSAIVEQKKNPNFAIVIRADKDINYERVIAFMDTLKTAGVTRFGLATDGAN